MLPEVGENGLITPELKYPQSAIGKLCRPGKSTTHTVTLAELERAFPNDSRWPELRREIQTNPLLTPAVAGYQLIYPPWESLIKLGQNDTSLQELLWRTQVVIYPSKEVKLIYFDRGHTSPDYYFNTGEKLPNSLYYLKSGGINEPAIIYQLLASCLAKGDFPEIPDMETLNSYCQQNNLSYDPNSLRYGFVRSLGAKSLTEMAEAKGMTDEETLTFIQKASEWLLRIVASQIQTGSKAALEGISPYPPEISNLNTGESYLPHPACLPAIFQTQLVFMQNLESMVPPNTMYKFESLHYTNCMLYELLYKTLSEYVINVYPASRNFLAPVSTTHNYSYEGQENSFQEFVINKVFPNLKTLSSIVSKSPECIEIEMLVRHVMRSCWELSPQFAEVMHKLKAQPEKWNKTRPVNTPIPATIDYNQLRQEILKFGAGPNTGLGQRIRFEFRAKHGNI